ncbi:MAG: phosphoribosylanthranilate isomerase [Chromatiales bacterium]|nr:phosphoribosylanthranilate isomerase [Gammaproteobacteria bacterium]MBW6476013.1 phosphoribosylanthranilate isomerase [Chromatiales bacterium]
MPTRTRIKICGITRPEDGLLAARAGADAIGLVFYAPSPRAVTVEQAAAICAALPPFVTTVGLFVDASQAEVEQVLRQVPLDLLQFHGDEPPAFCRGFGRPWIKALRMAEGVELAVEAERYHDAQGLLLDSFQQGLPGGTGHAFDWARIPAGLQMPIILAGGLNPQNIQQAVQTVRPWAVDVSSGVEASKGIKDADKINAFMRGVHTADVE